MKVIGRLGMALLPLSACLNSAKACSAKVNADKTHENMNGVHMAAHCFIFNLGGLSI